MSVRNVFVWQNLFKDANIKPVKSINFMFDPFHEKVASIRQVLFHLNSRKILETNLNCKMIVSVKSDRLDPEMKAIFNDDTTVIFKTKNLSLLEIFQKFNTICKSKNPKQQEQQ